MTVGFTNQIISSTDGTEKRLPFGRHLLEQFRMRFPIVPLAIDGVVTTENSEAVVLFVCPRVCAMCQRLREKEERTSRTLISIPNRRILTADCVGCCVDGFMARCNKESTPLSIFDWVQLPDDTG